MVGGRIYVPQEDPNYRAEGVASWYGSDFHGRLTANGEVYDMHGISAAHPTLPMPCYVRVTNVANQRSLIVRVNDRGPYAANREIDLSGKAAELLGFRGNGLARVRVEYVGRAPLEGSDDRILLATLREGAPAPAPSTVMVASSKPFVPNLPDRSPVLRGSVPVPSERPFDLGEGGVEAALQSPLRTAVARRPPSPEILAAAKPSLREPAANAPVSAYAPVRYDGSAAFASGRGLY
jgi:rare lipoprotein A